MTGPAPSDPARDVVGHRLTRLAHRLAEAVLAAQESRDDGLHRTRTTARRLRAVLAAYRPLLDREVTEPLREELRWLARSLGAERDAEVLAARVGGLLDDEEARLVRGPVRRRLAAHRRAGASADHAGRVLMSDRCARLTVDVGHLAADPPWTATAEKPAAKVVRRRLRRELRRVEQRLEDVPARGSGAAAEREHDEAVHAVRKAAKRLRYAAEVARPAFGKDAGRLTRAARALTRALGERQDAAGSRALLRTLAGEAERAGEPSFTWGRLHAHEEAVIVASEAAVPALWHDVRRRRTAGWLR